VGGERGAGVGRFLAGVGDDMAVAETHDPAGMTGDLGIVRHQHDRDALAVEILEEREDLERGAAVERAGRLVGEQQASDWLTSARATATRCCWPPESCIGR
jgi:hypothetical protein